MQIGKQVKYVRNIGEAVEEGEGLVTAIAIDHEKRVVYRIQKDGAHPFNVDQAAINPTKEFVEDFTSLVQRIQQTTQAANARIKEITEEANEEISDMESALLGEPLDIEVPTPPVAPAEARAPIASA